MPASKRKMNRKQNGQLKKSDRWDNGRLALRAVQILCIVGHVVRLILQSVAGVVRIVGQSRYRHANERWTENKGAANKSDKRCNGQFGFSL